MKRDLLLALLAVLFSMNSVFAQQRTVHILGTPFTVRYNNNDMTAEICDYTYRIDEREFPMHKDLRRIKHKLENQTLDIPHAVVVDGNEYAVTSIGRAAFAGYYNFKYVNIPNTVQNIGEYAFFRTSVVEVKIPASVTTIGNRAFGCCTKLKEMLLPYSGITMGGDVYAESRNITVSIQTDGKPLMANNSAYMRAEQAKKSITAPLSVDVDVNIPFSSKTNEQTLVVIIANENYGKYKNNISDVRYAINDGRVFKNYCINTLGIPEKNIKYEENATLNTMRGRFDWLGRVASALKGDARIIVYYAGHGIPDEATGSAYLLPVDGVGTDVQSGYSLKSLYAKLGKMPSQDVTVFIDACFSGSQRGEGMLVANRGVAIAAKEDVPTGNLVVFSAAQGDETAFPYEEKGHGLFTYFLLKKLQETKGEVTYQELATYLEKQVSLHSLLVNDKPQTPSLNSSAVLSGKLKSMKLK